MDATGLEKGPPAVLVLEDGTVFEGYSFGAETTAVGEVVFNTSMTGYQEVLSDPSYAGQIVVLTYPLIGNYGINDLDFESRRVQVQGFIVYEPSPSPSHTLARMTLRELLVRHNIPGLAGIDTRALTRKLRRRGVMMGAVGVGRRPGELLEAIKTGPRYDELDLVRLVTTPAPYRWPAPGPDWRPRFRVVVVDCGVKFNILRSLTRLGCEVTVVPATATARDILSFDPDGILISPGPGDPALLDYLVKTAEGLVGRRPIMGICLGHQVLGRLFGGQTFKLKFGHRGANHPVKDLRTGRVYITAQNHGYAVAAEGLDPAVRITHINLNDGTVEGLEHPGLKVFSIQYHAEASPGPWDNMYLFEEFVRLMEGSGRKDG